MMKSILIGLVLILNLASFTVPGTDDYEIVGIYKAEKPADGTKVLTSGNDLKEVDLLLAPYKMNDGKYVVKITRKSSNLYKIDDKDIYIETKYCQEYSYSKEVALKIDNGYSSKGKVIF